MFPIVLRRHLSDNLVGFCFLGNLETIWCDFRDTKISSIKC